MNPNRVLVGKGNALGDAKEVGCYFLRHPRHKGFFRESFIVGCNSPRANVAKDVAGINRAS